MTTTECCSCSRRQREVGFWMKDTPMALDLVFIGQDGVIKAVKQGEPLSEALITPGQPVRFVLELKAGIAAKNDIARVTGCGTGRSTWRPGRQCRPSNSAGRGQDAVFRA